MGRLRLALAQTNPVLGDLRGNVDGLLASAHDAARQGARLMVTGEMAVSGYPIEDLAARPGFLADSRRAVEELASRLHTEGLGDLVVIVGHPDGPHDTAPQHTASVPRATPHAIATNAASVLHGGRIHATYAKHHLPNYSVFDEHRNFIPGDDLLVVRVDDTDIAVMICEDLWRDAGPVARVLRSGAGVVAVLNGSPYERDKDEVRLPLVTNRALETGAIVAYVNLVGGQDDLVFDGDSMVVNGSGTLLARSPLFEPDLLVVDIDTAAVTDREPDASVTRVTIPSITAHNAVPHPPVPARNAPPLDPHETVWKALTTGLRDYVEKNGFGSVALGLSGGIDSAVCAVIAADAIGADRVYGISMPSRWSSEHSRTDADDLVARVGLHYDTQPIADLVSPIEEQLALTGVAAENLQARIRGLILMGLSNMHGHLVLTTSNKTELSVGYSTIYGDSVGGFAPLKDVPKSLVWELARWRNADALATGETPPIPENSISKPPSAELRPDQIDQDSLPPYDVLDPLLEQYVAQNRSVNDLVELGFDRGVATRVASLVDRSEWKRRQGAIGPRISGMAFGRDRRLPITHRQSRTER